MNRPYTAPSPYSLTPTERFGSHGDEPPFDDFAYDADWDADYTGDYQDEYADVEDYDEARIDRRWMWIAGVAGVVLFIAVVTTGVILSGGDSGSVKATPTSAAPITTAAPATTTAPPAATTSAAPLVPSLPPETVTTVTPTAEAPAAAPVEAAPPPPAPSPRTITYRVTGNRQLIDLVTIIYTDHQGALQTDINVALPWAKTIVLDPGVELTSVTATSVAGQLNCSITDAAGTLITAQNTNSMISTCTN